MADPNSRPREGSPSGGAGPDVLIADDEELVREMLVDALGEAGHSVAEAVDGKDTIAKILELRPRVVICDVRMPRQNGYEVLREIRKNHPELATVPFVFLTGLADKEYIEAGYKIGADDYLTKPVDTDLLCMKVGAMLRQLDRMAPYGREADATPTSTPSSGAEGSTETPIDETIREGVRRGGMSGSVQLVSLDEFREMFGDEWERLRDKALGITEGIIRKRLKSGDRYTSYDGDGYLILYKDADEAEAKRRVTALADELRVHLLGEDHASYRHLQISAITVDTASILDADGNVDFGLLTAAHRAARSKEGAQEPAADAPPPWFKEQLSVRYQPVWGSVREAVAAFQCVPLRTTPYGELWGRHVLHGGATDPWAILVDEFLAQTIAPYFDASSPYSDVAAICLPIHFQSLSVDNIQKLETALSQFSPELIRNKLIIQIIGLPEFRGSANVQRAVQWARDHTQHVAVELPPDDRHLAIARSAGADIMHLRFPSSEEEDKRRRQLKQVQEQGAQLKRLGMRGMIEDVDRLDQFAVVARAGFQFVSGKVIGLPIEGPRPPYALSARKIAG